MESLVVPDPLRAKLGDNGSEGLIQMFSLYNQIATERFERRLTEEISFLRLELHDSLAALRHEFSRELAITRVQWLKWSFLFWIGQVAVVIGALAYLLPRAGS
jgi:hypothetical protein